MTEGQGEGRVRGEMGRLRRARSVRIGSILLAFAVTTAVTYLIARPRIYTGFSVYDDEGYMLIALKSFLNHGHLYDDVFTQYGPFYYGFWGAIFSLFGIAVDHDGGRLLTALAWVLSSLGLGLASWRMTRSALLGLAVQMLCFGGLFTLVNEPMHPGGLICLLLTAIVGLSCLLSRRTSPFAAAALGGAAMALILVKINVGSFALLSIALACAISYPALAARRWLRPLVELAFVALPLLLVTSKEGEAWARHYGVHVAIAALAVVVVLRARSDGRRSTEELRWLLGGLIAVAVVSCFVVLATGTSPGGLFEGVVTQPLRQSGAFSLPLQLSNRIYLYDLAGLAAACCYWYVARGRTSPSAAWVALGSVLTVFVGLTMALSVIGRDVLFGQVDFSGHQLGMLAFAWVALIPFRAVDDEDTSFARLLLPPLAVLQALHAFPVAGSQLAWSTFLIIPVGALCVANGLRGLASCLGPGRERRAAVTLGVAVAAVFMVVLANIQLRQPLQQARAAYDAAVPLDLPGAGEVRVSPEEAAKYQALVAMIRNRCTSFLMLPGMDSLYLWTGIEPPTYLNATGWSSLFDPERQRRVIEETRGIEGLCALEYKGLAQYWTGYKEPTGPLVRYLRRDFSPVSTLAEYELRKREGREP